MERDLILIRHGLSAHVAPKLLNLEEFLRWREEYEKAGIAAHDLPPQTLRDLVATAGVIVSSDVRRAIESAQALSASMDTVRTPLLRELSLHPPQLERLRLPLLGWGMLFGARALLRWKLEAHVTAEERIRAEEAADFLTSLSDTHPRVVGVTHASFRALLAGVLASRGWGIERPRRRSAHWSAWRIVRR